VIGCLLCGWAGLNIQHTGDAIMVTVGMNYMILEGKEKAFETVFYKVLDIMEAMEGHKKSHLFHDARNSQHYLIVSEWHSKDAFDTFTQSDKFKSVVDWGKEQILASRPHHEIYGGGDTTAPAEAGCPVPH